MSWRGANSGYALRQAHPETPAHPALLGKPERDLKVNIKGNIVGAPSRRASFSSVLDNPKEDLREKSVQNLSMVLTGISAYETKLPIIKSEQIP